MKRFLSILLIFSLILLVAGCSQQALNEEAGQDDMADTQPNEVNEGLEETENVDFNEDEIQDDVSQLDQDLNNW